MLNRPNCHCPEMGQAKAGQTHGIVLDGKIMIRHSGHKVLRQLCSQTNKPSAIWNAIDASSSNICRLANEPDGVTNNSAAPDRTPSGSWREYSTSSRGLRSFAALQQSLAEPLLAPVLLPSDIVPDDLVINVAQHLKVKPTLDATKLKFGAEYTDHMLHIAWKEGLGWGTPSIDPLGPIPIHPCAQVLHYAMECFEGMKAFKDKDGRIRLFRPEMNMNRLARSAARVGLPAFDKVWPTMPCLPRCEKTASLSASLLPRFSQSLCNDFQSSSKGTTTDPALMSACGFINQKNAEIVRPDAEAQRCSPSLDLLDSGG